MKATKAGRLESALNDIFQLLSQYGDVTVNASVGGRTVQIRLVDGEGAPAVSAAARRTERPAGRSAKAEGNAPDTERVFDAISGVPIGLTLEDLATKLDVRPRNLLKPVIQSLVRDGRVIKVGRRHRSAAAVVRRGPPPKEDRAVKAAPAGKPGRKKAVSQAKLDALSKARAARAAKRLGFSKKAPAVAAKGKPGRKPGRPAKVGRPAKSAPEKTKPVGVSENKLSALAKAREALARARELRSGKAGKGGKPGPKPKGATKAAKPAKAAKGKPGRKPGKVMGGRAAQRKNAMTDDASNPESAGSSSAGDQTSGAGGVSNT